MTSIEERSILCYVYITEDCVAIKIMLKNNYFHEKKKLSKKIKDCSTDATRNNQNQSSKELNTGR